MYEIKITAENMPELAGKLAALTAQLTQGGREIVVRVPDAPKVETPKAEAPKAEPPKPVALDYQRDIAPRVLALVEAKGRAAAENVLARYGVKKALQVPPERFAELMSDIQNAMGES
jgi:hypothetical protein